MSTVDQGERTRRGFLRPNAIGAPTLIFIVIATVGPMGAVLGASPLVFMESGAAAPAVYLLAAGLFLLFSVGYLAVNRQLGSAGGFVVYIARGFSHRAGTGASYVALLTYMSLLAALYGAFSVFASQTFLQLTGIDVPWPVWAFGAVILIGLLVFRKLEVNGRILGVALVLEVLMILWLAFAILFGGEGGSAPISFNGFQPQLLLGPGLGLAFLFALASFGSFEATVVYSEEAKSPRKTIPRATYGAVIILGLFYAFATFAISNGAGVARVQEAALEDPTGFILALTGEYLGPVAVVAMSVLVVTSFFAILLGVTNILSRYVFALARANVLPRTLAVTHRKHGGPSRAGIVVSAVTFVVLLVFLLAGADPFTNLYTWLIAIGTIAILTVIAVTSASGVAYFYLRDRATSESVWAKLIAPLISLSGFVVALILAVVNFPLLTGGEPGSVENLLWLVVPVLWTVGYVVGMIRGPEKSDFSTIAELLGKAERSTATDTAGTREA